MIDPRIIFLERAAAKLILIEACCQDLDSAFSDLVVAFREIAVPPCPCERETSNAFDRRAIEFRQQRFRAWRRRS